MYGVCVCVCVGRRRFRQWGLYAPEPPGSDELHVSEELAHGTGWGEKKGSWRRMGSGVCRVLWAKVRGLEFILVAI